jgi:hypothetical protein
MFIVQTNDGLITETRGGWKAAPNGLLGVHLVHPAINVSVGLLGYDKYAFIGEGVSIMQGGGSIPRLAEHLYAVKGDLIWHICLRQNGEIVSHRLDELPDTIQYFWRYKVINE